MAKTSNALRLVEGTAAKKASVHTPTKKSVRKKAKSTYNAVKVAKNIRHEATTLRKAANALFVLGMFGELACCIQYNTATLHFGVWGGLGVCLIGLIFCLGCTLLATFIHGTCAILERNAGRLSKGAK